MPCIYIFAKRKICSVTLKSESCLTTPFLPEDYRLDSRGAGEQGSRGAGEQGSRGAGEQGSRGAGEQGSRGAGEQGSRGAGE
ncbi:hypothetical protein JYQ62_27780 [Nostoc sp. UHCC 0702]|nr:hypothetical protein JYQ62_27780 [Nostoc sp. UHCC 0702]